MAYGSAFGSARARAMMALHRFGFGPRGDGGGADTGGVARAFVQDPRGALLAELRPGAGRIAASGLLDSGAAARAMFEFRQQRKARRLAASAKGGDARAADEADSRAGALVKRDGAAHQKAKHKPTLPQRIYLAEAEAHYQAALRPETGFVERLVWFWSNHFCVSADKGQVRALCGAYEREAIRPHVLGRFSDMLLAVETHPAMLLYLDNARSMGPDSRVGLRRGKGLNENLAREILELHTLGVRTVYDQRDVTTFAKVLTGWTVRSPRGHPETGGTFMFNPRMHEPGAETLIGRTYPEQGFAQGRDVLEWVAHHPATARHIAFKLARHFVADTPPPMLVDRLAARFLDTGGDLMEVTKALVTAPEAWQAPRAKLKKPGEWIVGALRATGYDPKRVQVVLQFEKMLGEPLWRPPAPKGFPDVSAAWIGGLAQRLDIANRVAHRSREPGREPDDMVDAALGPLASADTRRTVGWAESRSQALALLLMAPEFQRR